MEQNADVFVLMMTEVKAGEIWDSYVYQSYFLSKEEVIEVLKDYTIVDAETDKYAYKDKYGTTTHAQIYELNDYYIRH